MMAGRSRQREARAAAGPKLVKDTVVFRSDVSASEAKVPVMRNPDKVRDYFSQYGDCEVIFEQHHSIRGGLDRHAMVIRFKETSIANKVKQKYNGRVLFDARITTSWLDMRQMRELGMSQPGRRKGRGKHSLGRGRGKSSPLYSREDSSSPATGSRYQSSSSLTSANYSTSGTDTESSVESGSYVPDSPPSVTKFQGVTRLEQSSRLSPVSTPIPPGLSPPRERSPTRNRKKSSSSPYSRRHSSQERSDSRTSSHSSKDKEKDRETDRQREKASSPKYSTRLRSKRKLSDTDKGASTSTSTESPSRNTRSSRGYGPYSKKYRDDSSDSQSSKGDLKSSKTVFDRLGPTKDQADELDQIEKYGEVETKGKKPSGSALLSPEQRSRLKSPTSDEAKQSSGSSDKEVRMGPEKEEQGSTLHKADRSKNSRSTRGNRPRTRSQSDYRKPKSVQESSMGDHQETKKLPESTSTDTQVKDRVTVTQDKEMESQRADTSVREGQLDKEHPQKKAGKEKEDSHQLRHHNSPSVTEELGEGEAISRQQTEPSAPGPTANVVHSDSAGVHQQTSRTLAIDYKAMKESIMKEFDEHADILVTSCKILSTQNLTSQQLVESSLETSLMHLAATFMAKFQERMMAAKASQK